MFPHKTFCRLTSPPSFFALRALCLLLHLRLCPCPRNILHSHPMVRIDSDSAFPRSKCDAARLKVLHEVGLLTRHLSPFLRVLHRGECAPPREGEIVLFVSFFLLGLVPPFSEFFTTIISFYNICHLHLNPTSILMLSIFAHLCENFV